jgi:hypothetical protein
MSTKRKFTVKAATELTDDQAQMLHQLSEFAADVIADVESDYGKKLSQNGWGAVMDYTENIVKHPEDVERLVGKGLDSMKLHLEAVICDIYEDDTGIQGIYESTSIRSDTKVRKFTIKAASSDKFYTREFPSVEAGKVKVAPQRGNWTVFIGLSDGTIAYQWCESKEKALREAKYARDVVKKYGSDAPYWTAEGYKIWNPKAEASTSIKRKAVKGGYTPKKNVLWLFDADAQQWVPWGTWAKDTVTEEELYELNHRRFPNSEYDADYNYTDYMLLPNDGSEPDDGRKVRASTSTKRKFSVKASATAKRKAAIKASDLSDKSEYHLYGYDKDGADVDTRYTRSANDIADAVDELFSYDEVDTVDIYRGGMSVFGDYIGTVTRDEHDSDSAGRVRELLEMNGIKGSKSVKCATDPAVEDFKDTWTRNIFDKTQQGVSNITVYFKDGRSATYTTAVFDDMTTDSSVDYIIDAETGELLYDSEQGVMSADSIECATDFEESPEDGHDFDSPAYKILRVLRDNMYLNHDGDEVGGIEIRVADIYTTVNNGFAFDINLYDPDDYMNDTYIKIVSTLDTYENDTLLYRVGYRGKYMRLLRFGAAERLNTIINDIVYGIKSGSVKAYTSTKCSSDSEDVPTGQGIDASTKIESAFRDPTIDKEAVRELVLTITNDGDLYREKTTPILENLKKKAAKGKYDRELAVKLWQYLADEGVRRYGRDFGSGYSVSWLNPATRQEIAKELRDYYEEQVLWDVNHPEDTENDLVTL